ncbi:MAG: host attachment protein [Gammaproteobacteria bacterium]
MSDCFVVVAAGSCARFFTLEPAEFPEMESGPNLVEQHRIENEEWTFHGDEVYSDTKSGRNRGRGGAGAHGYDDHRNQHHDEIERRFARDIAEEMQRITKKYHPKKIVLVAQKKLLGNLRGNLQTNGSEVVIEELAKDLCKFGPNEVHQHLAKAKLLPPRRSPS